MKSLKVCLGWDTRSDIDASILMYDKDGNCLDKVWWRKTASSDNSIKHGGDDRTGEGKGDDECIIVELHKVNP